jgi:uncharacterized repeat protein (TIGR01451 family)
VRYVKGAMGFPTGLPESSGLLLEKIVPAEVSVGQPFSYEYRVSNLTDFHLHQVVVTDRVTDNFTTSSSDPPAQVSGGVATWNLDALGPRETKSIKVTGSASAEGTITTCGWATYSPILCCPIPVTKPAIELTKTMPANVMQCDPIPVRLTVRNAGTSRLTGVKVVDSLPDGLTADSSTSFDVGTLEAGQSRDLSFNARASRTGHFVNPARATSDQNVEATAEAAVTVCKPVLEITCEAPARVIAGRAIEVCFTVRNTGDCACNNTTLQVTIPGGVRFTSATEGGTSSGAGVSWNLGSIEAGGSKRVCFTAASDTGGTYNFTGTANCVCAEPASTTCTTTVEGVPGVLLEVIDTVDPIEVGQTTTYIIRVTNQGNIPITNVRIVGTRDPAQEYVEGTGVSEVTRVQEGIGTATVASVAPKATIEWRVVMRATAVKNAVLRVVMTCDQLGEREETETTNQY